MSKEVTVITGTIDDREGHSYVHERLIGIPPGVLVVLTARVATDEEVEQWKKELLDAVYKDDPPLGKFEVSQ